MNVRVFAPAKINLTLEVGRPRNDGRHPLRSIVAFADVGDALEVAAAPDLTLTITGPFADSLRTDETNMAMRAARALAASTGRTRSGAALKLTKNLPIASGIGGGSSDAAAALKALNVLWGLGRDEAQLCALARGLGADVSVCVHARSALMTGAGEEFAPLAMAPMEAVLVNPLRPLSTAAVYRQFDAMALGTELDTRAPLQWGGEGRHGNDLETAAIALMPELRDMRFQLEALPGARHVGLSGSGATMFVILDSGAAAHESAAALRRVRPTWWIAPTRLGALDPAAPPG
ncbi:MAG: 4-(cytidine 5'-diphospho)-2-C-methyl-D-erythritol kinase [Terricaulis sp.]